MVHTDEWRRNWKPPYIIHNVPTRWYWIVAYPDHLDIGKYVDIGAFTYIMAQEGITICDDVEIGSHCSIYSANTIDDTRGEIVLRENCKIGSHSVILPGVTIGENSIVGAFSLVKEDIQDDAVVAGTPAEIIKYLS